MINESQTNVSMLITVKIHVLYISLISIISIIRRAASSQGARLIDFSIGFAFE